MCPAPPTGRYIVPTHPLEPSGGGGATAHSGLSRTGPYCGPADLAISPFSEGCTFGNMPRCQISADSSAQRLPRLKVHRWPPIVGPYPIRVPRRDWRSRYVGTPPLRHPPSALSRLTAPANSKIAYRAAGRAVTRCTICPTPPTGLYIVPTHPLEPSGGGGTTTYSGLSRTGPYVELRYIGGGCQSCFSVFRKSCSVY